jgi:DNA-binding MarR family transcriptional regulator
MNELIGVDLCHCLASRRSARMLTRLYDKHLAGAAINTSQFSILALIAANPGIKVAELAERLVMERTTLVRSLKPLRAAGLVDAGTGSGRGHQLLLTEAGLSRHKQGEPMWLAAQAEIEERFGRDRVGALRRDLLDLTMSA